MTKRIDILSAALVLALSGAAYGQTADPFGKAMEGAPPAGVPRGSPRVPQPGPVLQQPGPQATNPLDDLARGMRARQAGGGAPVVVVPAQGGGGVAVVGQSGPAGPAPDAADPSVEINANYDVTMDIYQKLLETQGMDTGGLEKRIASNQEIVARYSPELTRNEDELRKLQVGFMNRAFQLRQQKDSGQITEDMFQKAILEEEGKWNRKKSAIAGDAVFFREEVEQAQARITQLQTTKVSMEARLEREGKSKPKPKPPGEALFEGFNGTLDKLSGFRTRLTMDGNKGCQSCNGFQHGNEEEHEE